MGYKKDFVLPPQLHVKAHNGFPETDCFREVENTEYSPYFLYHATHELHRPRGGIWTSTYDEHYGSDWFQWNIHSKYNGVFPSNHIMHSFLLNPSKTAKVYTLDSYEDLDKLMYRFRNSLPSNKRKKVPFLDFERISRHYDGLHLTKKGLALLENTSPYFLRHWDCESTIWFHLNCFSSIEPLGQKRYRRDKNHKMTPLLIN